jgi:putative peptidoglycan lipid II flippase
VRLTFAAVLFTILPAMAGLIAAAPAIVAMLYLHGAFSHADVLSTAETLRLLAIGLPALAGVRVMVPIYYALGDARTPVAVSAATLLVTAVLGWELSRFWEVRGLALGLSGGIVFQCALLALLLRRKTRQLGPWFPWRSAGVQAAAALVCGAMAYQLASLGEWPEGAFSARNWGVFSLTLVLPAVTYLAITLSLREPQARNWLRLLRRAAALLRRTAGRLSRILKPKAKQDQ